MSTPTSAGTAPGAQRRLAVVSVGHAARAATAWLTAEADQRQARPWLGLVGIALGSTAVLLTDVPVLLPLLAVCAWWWCARERFAWLIPIGAGVLTVAWVTVGVGLIALLPLSTAGLLWISLAAAFALLATAVRTITEARR